MENDKKINIKANCPDLPFSEYRFVKNKIKLIQELFLKSYLNNCCIRKKETSNEKAKKYYALCKIGRLDFANYWQK